MTLSVTTNEYLKLATKPKKERKSSAGWRTIGDKAIYFRSKWEANYGRYLQFLKENNSIADWQHEPTTFWFFAIARGVRSYLPDFRIEEKDGSHWWTEVKGYMDAQSKTKIARFRKYYPTERLVIVCGKWFKSNNSKMRKIVKGWE